LAAPENQVFTELVWLPGIFRFSISTQYINNLYTQLENAPRDIEATTEDYLMLNISANSRINDWLDVFIKAENLLDTQYRINQGYPMPGFTVFGGVKVNYR
jgi:iron complex outermembrane receptor protein